MAQRINIDPGHLGSVQGSSYRQPGALMVCKYGTYEGNISAGCLEVDLFRKAAWLIRDGSAVGSGANIEVCTLRQLERQWFMQHSRAQAQLDL
jgi:xanthine/CO dehydrogenase XdhC/CoxF family maturation factor